MSRNGFFGKTPRPPRPIWRTIWVMSAPARPSAIVQPISSQVTWLKCGSCSGTSEYALVLRPVQFAMPRNTSEPTPPAISPGIRISGSIAPPSPLASMTRIAATMGEPKMTEIAAKLPAAAMMRSNCGGASRFASFTENVASPAPIAMSGASGPSTRPRPRVANAARAMPGTMFGSLPPIWSPLAGTCPPLPGRRTIANATGSPARPSTTRYHQFGTDE